MRGRGFRGKTRVEGQDLERVWLLKDVDGREIQDCTRAVREYQEVGEFI